MKKNEMHFYQLLRDFLGDYLITKRNLSEKTARVYRQTLKLFRQYFSEEKGMPFDQMNFSCFSRDSVYDYLLWLKNSRNNSAETINLRLSAIKSFLKYCSEEDIELTAVYLDIAGIHAFKSAKPPRVEYLTQNHLKLIFSIPDVSTRLGRRDRFFMIFAYETGARIQELLDLRLSSIARSDIGVRLRIHGKGNKVRYIPILGTTNEHLKAYLAEFHRDDSPDSFLFYTIHDARKTQMKPGAVDYFLKKYAKAACEADESFPVTLHAHMFRHSIAMAMHKSGIPISYIRDFLGHSNIETTSIYSYSDDETIVRALEAVELGADNVRPSAKRKDWKSKEQYLLDYCGLR